jgi:6-phosphofructokinase 1
MVVAEANKAGRSFEIAQEIKQKTGSDYRVCILGHTQRGGSPTVLDRTQGTAMGVMAVQALQQGKSNKMVAVQQGRLCLIDFPPVTAPANRFSDLELLKINDMVCK